MSKYMVFSVVLFVLLAGFGCQANEDIRVIDRPSTEVKNDFYIGNRPPLLPSPFMRRQLELQADGFHGHLTEISRFLVKEGNAWLSPTGEGDHGWEEPPYWLKGFSNCGYILGNERMINESRIWIESALRSQNSA